MFSNDTRPPITVHKRSSGSVQPLVSLILLDWNCRERFHTLEWLARQTAARSDYEIIWVELHDRVLETALRGSDTVITCHQRGLYHKHLGYNIGLLHARGRILTVCDSDAVYPPEFISSICTAFAEPSGEPNRAQVLMHHQYRTGHLYPDDLEDVTQLARYKWRELWPNVGACMSVRRDDAIAFGGFDEHPSFRGYMCGPYDLGWRLVNAGLPELWHDVAVASWHFAHPDPWGSNGEWFNWSRWSEKAYPHIEGHAFTAVDAFVTGRVLPLRENPQIRQLRLDRRRIGTPFEERYARMRGPEGFSTLDRLRLFGELWSEPAKQIWKGFKRRAFETFDRSPEAQARRKQRWLADPVPPKAAANDASLKEAV